MENFKFKKENVQQFLEMDLAELLEDALLSEGDGLEMFQMEAEAVASALKDAGVPAGKVSPGRARSLFLMRAFYFLGVLRGGEAVRNMLLGEDVAEDKKFVLAEWCTQRFAEELEALDCVELARVCKVISL